MIFMILFLLLLPADLPAEDNSEIAELFSIDVFPDDAEVNHRLLKYCIPGWDAWHDEPLGARLMNTMSKLLSGKNFVSYEYDPFSGDEPDPTDRVIITYSGGITGDIVDIIRTYSAPITAANNFLLNNENLQTGSRLPVYEVSGTYTDRGVVETDNAPHIEFAANELRHDQVLMVVEDVDATPVTTYSQAIQLERGWNLVSWYLVPVGQPGEDIYMDDLFSPPPPPPDEWWFDWDNYTAPTDKVGRYDKYPQPEELAEFYPQYGSSGSTPPQAQWEWDLQQAYPIYMESPAHFWEFPNKPIYNAEEDSFTPHPAWDDYEQAGIPVTPNNTTYWYFIAYPLRKQILLRDSNTIDWLVNTASNRVDYIKDDDGKWFNPSDPTGSTLQYLKPGKGYYLGYGHEGVVTNCPWFTNEGSVPEYTPPDPKENQQTVSSSSHFTYKDHTHWWYPIEIDTVIIEELTPETGDEIGVFDGDLCVGAACYDGSFPIYMAAWMDDIATPTDKDGYFVDNEMTFVWYDASENTEITFNPPPTTQAMQPESDPYHPAHSGFGSGLFAVRTLGYGVQSVNQLPKSYSLGQNYPNPFNAETVIPLELPQRSRIQIDLYNVRGQLMSRIYRGIQGAGQAHIRYNASRLPSGVYFYRVMAEGLERESSFNDVGKMLLLK